MECPKCGLEIDDKAMVCPNCKKVLKLVCPVCKTINEQNVCKKCGYVILSKCNNCGKINPTDTKKCKKCGFDTEKSIILNEANTESFVMITMQFPNLNDMKNILGSVKLYNKFKISLDKIINDYTKSVGLRRQVYGNTYVIRSTKDYTFKSSAATAVKAVIEILNSITAMNCKLTNKKNSTIRCNVFLLKRTVESDPNDLESGYNISLLGGNIKNKEDRILNTFQILADDEVSDAIKSDYKVSPLNSVMVNDEMVMFYEVDLKEHIVVEFPEEEPDEIKVPNFVQNLLLEQDKLDGMALNKLISPNDPDAIYDIDTINFEEIKSDFMRSENLDVLMHIINKFQANPKCILALKTAELYKPYTLKVLEAALNSEKFKNIITITCYDEMKYAPYSFFREFVSAIFEYTVSQKLFNQNDFSMFSTVDPDSLIKDLIFMNKREDGDKETNRNTYFDIFFTLFQIVPNTLIYIEDFDKIDSSSYDVMKYLFDVFEELDISLLLTYKNDYSLHKDSHFLINRPYYTEISLKPVSFENLVEENKVYFRYVLDNFYFQRIAKYACGSSMFIDMAIMYLCESGVFEADEDSVRMIDPKTIIIPSTLDKLLERRLNLLQDDAEAMKFLTSVVLLGIRIDQATIDALNYKNANEIIDKLNSMGYIYLFNNCYYFPNYNMLRKNILSTISPIYLKEVAEDLFDKVFDENMPSPVKADLYHLLKDEEKEQQEWENLAQVSLSFGDFNAYINCVDKIIQMLDNKKNDENFEEIESYKSELYQSISDNLYQYFPDNLQRIAEETLYNIEKTQDVDKIIVLCNKMINGAVQAGNYNHALELTHKVLSVLPSSSLNPSDANFNIYFFMMSLLHIQILFNIGALNDCIDLGFRVFNYINNETVPLLKPEYLSDEEFHQLIINSAAYVALANIFLMYGNVEQFLQIISNEISFIPQTFVMFKSLEDFILGRSVSVSDIEVPENDLFANVIRNILNAFINFEGDYVEFAGNVHKAKSIAKYNDLFLAELFADLLIAYAYVGLGNFYKANDIVLKIIKTAEKNGMTMLLYAAWYVLADMSMREGKYNVAYGILNNTLIQLEKSDMSGEYLLMLFRYAMYKVVMYRQEFDKAEICINHAKYIAAKHGLNFNFDTDPSHYIPVDMEFAEGKAEDIVQEDAHQDVPEENITEE